ncbi:hypothetical protein [Salibacterium sp. K-3]
MVFEKNKFKEKKNKRFNKPLLASAAAVIFSIGIWVSPNVQAVFNGLFEVSQYDEDSAQESPSFGNGFSNQDVYETEEIKSIEQAEKKFDTNIPFPSKLSDLQIDSFSKLYLDKSNNINGYQVSFQAKEEESQSISIHTSKAPKAEPTFKADTYDGTATSEEVNVDDTKAKIFGVDGIAYSIYLEESGWKFIITMVEKNGDKSQFTEEKQKRLIEIAKSIK